MRSCLGRKPTVEELVGGEIEGLEKGILGIIMVMGVVAAVVAM